MKQKGVVMKVQNGFCYVLTQDRQFLKLPLPPGAVVGQEIEWFPSDLQSKPKWNTKLFRQKRWIPLVGIVASVLLVIGVWKGYTIFQTPQVYAYVSVDINPSVEFTIDQKGQVFEQDGWNQDGTSILSKLSTLHKPIQTAVQSLFLAARQDGYLEKNKEVLITAIPATDQLSGTEQQSLTSLQNSLVTEAQRTLTGTSVQVKGLTVSKQVRTMARNLHVSPGKFVLYLQAQSHGIPLTIEDVQQESIAKIISEHKELSGFFDQLNPQQVDSLLEKWNSKSGLKSGQMKPAQDEPVHRKPAQDKPSQDHHPGQNIDKQSVNENINEQVHPPQNDRQKQDGEDQGNHKHKQHFEHEDSLNGKGNPPVQVDLGRSTTTNENADPTSKHQRDRAQERDNEQKNKDHQNNQPSEKGHEQ